MHLKPLEKTRTSFTYKAMIVVSMIAISLSISMIANASISDNAFADQSSANSSSSKKEKPVVKWTVKSSNVYCKVNGKTQKSGIKTINGKKYLFSKSGKQRVGWHKVGKNYYYFTTKAKAKGSMVTSKVVNGIRLGSDGKAKLNSTARSQLSVLLKATEYVEKHARLGWSESKKLRACYVFLRDGYTECAIRPFTSRSGWARLFAMDIFVRKTGSCHSCASALAYIANAIGCKKCKVVSSGGHSWAEINGKIYDAEWSRHVRADVYGWPYSKRAGNVPHYAGAGIYVVTVAPYSKVLGSSAKKSSSNHSTGKNGLISKKGKIRFYKDGKLVKSQWVDWKGSRYYFKRNGIAATGPTKIKGSYYVFNDKGKLFAGKKTRIVTYKGGKYRVTKAGKAKSGWDASKTHRYSKTGRMYTGDCVIGETFYAFGANGAYDANRTKLIGNAAKMDSDFAPLRALLGNPTKSFYSPSCNRLKDTQGNELTGDDGILEYKNFTVYTFKASNGIEYYRGVSGN